MKESNIHWYVRSRNIHLYVRSRLHALRKTPILWLCVWKLARAVGEKRWYAFLACLSVSVTHVRAVFRRS